MKKTTKKAEEKKTSEVKHTFFVQWRNREEGCFYGACLRARNCYEAALIVQVDHPYIEDEDIALVIDMGTLEKVKISDK